MNRVALFAAGLGVAFVAALGLGRGLDVGARTVAEGHDAPEHQATAAGLALEQDGYRLVADGTAVAGREAPFVFRILAPDGSVLRDYEVAHERRLHLIVVGRAPDGPFLHLHPEQRADGAWTAPLRLPAAGSYRVFADFTTDGTRRTLGTDLSARGGPATAPFPRTPFDIELRRDGEHFAFDVRRDGSPADLEPYLGALGHLVVLREGDLAYVHAHAEEGELAFDVPLPSEGRYRVVLQFQVAGRVETARFEVEQ